MRPALLLFGYALALAWWAPALLSRLTAPGVSPRLGQAACLQRPDVGLRNITASWLFTSTPPNNLVVDPVTAKTSSSVSLR